MGNLPDGSQVKPNLLVRRSEREGGLRTHFLNNLSAPNGITSRIMLQKPEEFSLIKHEQVVA